MRKYTLTDEHREQLEPWAKKWIKIIMSTKPMDTADREAMILAIHGLYKAASLKPPSHIVFVPSPFVLRFAGGFAAGIWHLRAGRRSTDDASRDATTAATTASTHAATQAATTTATDEATYKATRDATYNATSAATYATTDNATRTATRDATDEATSNATQAATRAATQAATDAATHAATIAATHAATRAATIAATPDATDADTEADTRDATDAATHAATRAATIAATYDATTAATDAATTAATDAATQAATTTATDEATSTATRATYIATYAATIAATHAATRAATNDATIAATDEATRATTYDATYDATDAATRAATRDATALVTDAATHAATDAASSEATRDAAATTEAYFLCPDLSDVDSKFGPVERLMRCAYKAYRMWDGGNQWGQWVSFISFFRHVAKLGLDYAKWDHYEKAAIHGGPRIMHKEFCMVSDRPREIHVDQENRPHKDGGPFTSWRDGTAIYALHGVYVPPWLALERAEEINPKRFTEIKNAQVRCEFVRKVGIERIIQHCGARSIDKNGDYELLEIDLIEDQPARYLKMRNPSEGVWHVEGVDNSCQTVQESINWRMNCKKGESWAPSQLT